MILFQNQSFNTCFRRYYQTLCYFAYRYVQEVEKSEDIVQEAFVGLLEKTVDFQDEDHFKRYLYKIVRNACLNHIKLTSIHAEILERLQSEQNAEAPDFFNGIVRAEVYHKIMAAIEELPTECGRVFKLAYVDGLDNEDIAKSLNISINTVKSQKNKAKNQLREKLQDLYPIAILILHLV